IADRERLRVSAGIDGIARAAMPAHIPQDQPAALGEMGDLTIPQAHRLAEAMGQQDGRALAMGLVSYRDAIAIDEWHPLLPESDRRHWRRLDPLGYSRPATSHI